MIVITERVGGTSVSRCVYDGYSIYGETKWLTLSCRTHNLGDMVLKFDWLINKIIFPKWLLLFCSVTYITHIITLTLFIE